VRVLRLREGDACVLFNGDGFDHDVTIASATKRGVDAVVGDARAIDNESPLRLVLLQGIARGEKMDLILQKATELGAHSFVPVKMARSTVRLDERAALVRQQHWQAVVTSACEQSGRNTVPAVAAPATLSQCLGPAPGLRLLLAPGEGSQSLSALLAGATPTGGLLQRIELLVGPEGGFDPAETAAATAAGFQSCRLGPRILRTETAGLAALAALQTLAGDLK
jgi:16S rRNA (uracil1498-N3)-methyltransferase